MIRHALLACTPLVTGCASHEGRPSNVRISSVRPAHVTVTRDFVYTPANWPQAVVAGDTPVDLRYYKHGPLANGLTGVSYDETPACGAKPRLSPW